MVPPATIIDLCTAPHVAVSIGGALWRSSVLLSELIASSVAPHLDRWVTQNVQLLQGTRIVELGGGVGLVSLVCFSSGLNVTYTDYDPEVRLT
jgi:hypothetical protein